jgi:hypothetical protein
MVRVQIKDLRTLPVVGLLVVSFGVFLTLRSQTVLVLVVVVVLNQQPRPRHKSSKPGSHTTVSGVPTKILICTMYSLPRLADDMNFCQVACSSTFMSGI